MSLDVSAGGAFVAGLLSFASPCVLPLVPPYLAYMGGVSVEELRAAGGAGQRLRVLLAALCFVAGFSTVFVALGATASFIGQAVSGHLGILARPDRKDDGGFPDPGRHPDFYRANAHHRQLADRGVSGARTHRLIGRSGRLRAYLLPPLTGES